MNRPYEPRERVHLRGVLTYVYKTMGRAIVEHDMLNEGDHVLVAVSGGVDSLSLLKLLLLRQARIPIKFNITACFVDMDFVKADKAPLIKYLEDEDVKYVIRPLSFTGQEMGCFWCSWNRRKVLFEAARDCGCNKIAFGHHLDDVAQTILMNMFFRGEISTAPANLSMFNGAARIIRPLCYVSKQALRDFGACFAFPKDDFVCPFGKESRREMMKKIIADLEVVCPEVKKNITRSLKKIKEGYLV